MITDQQLLAPSVSSSTPQFLVICETVTANLTDYVFAEGSEIIFLENASSLEVSSGSRVEFRETFLHGCEKLWFRILIKDGGQCEFNSGCRIEDAVAGNWLEPNSVLIAESSEYDGNYIGIFAGEQGANPNKHSVTASIRGTVFSGAKNLIEPYFVNGNPGNLHTGPRYGIWAEGVQSLNVGSSSGGTNLFKEYTNSHQGAGLGIGPFGIYSDNSSFTVVNSQFQDIDRTGGGRGINFVTNPGATSKLTLTGLGQDATPTFENVGTGVYGLGNMNIQHCGYNNLERGIYLSGLPSPYQVTIERNAFNQIEDASIFADNSSPFNNLRIRFNDFNDDVAFPIDPVFSIPRPAIRISSFTPGQQTAWMLRNTFTNSAKTGHHALS